jgi:hypothetical protein
VRKRKRKKDVAWSDRRKVIVAGVISFVTMALGKVWDRVATPSAPESPKGGSVVMMPRTGHLALVGAVAIVVSAPPVTCVTTPSGPRTI